MIISFPFLLEDEDGKMLKNGILGLVIYGTYGFTLSAFMPKYDIYFALTETMWGVFIYNCN